MAVLQPRDAAMAQEVLRIAAIVNDEIISVYDLENRVRLVVATTKIPNRPDVLKRVERRILRSMIDEKLRLQEAKRTNVRVTNRDIKMTIDRIERQNKMPSGGIFIFLRRNRINRVTLETQIRARIAWLKLINRRFRRQITIGEDEISEELERLRALQGKPRSRISEIFLSVDTPENERQVRETAERLIRQIAGGARFAALAREFSQSTSAAAGGDLGWMIEGEMDPKLETAIAGLNSGEVSPPIRTLTGYHILRLTARQVSQKRRPGDTLIDYRQLLLPVPRGAGEAEENSQRLLASELAASLSSCADLVEAGRSVDAVGMDKLVSLRAGEANAELRRHLMTQKIGQPSEPIRTSQGYFILIVCKRVDPGSALPKAKMIEERLRGARLDLMAQRYIRDLRRNAYIDIRR